MIDHLSAPRLASMPDWKGVPLTLGKNYDILGTIGNGVIIQSDNPDLRVVILRERLE